MNHKILLSLKILFVIDIIFNLALYLTPMNKEYILFISTMLTFIPQIITAIFCMKIKQKSEYNAIRLKSVFKTVKMLIFTNLAYIPTAYIYSSNGILYTSAIVCLFSYGMTTLYIIKFAYTNLYRMNYFIKKKRALFIQLLLICIIISIPIGLEYFNLIHPLNHSSPTLAIILTIFNTIISTIFLFTMEVSLISIILHKSKAINYLFIGYILLIANYGFYMAGIAKTRSSFLINFASLTFTCSAWIIAIAAYHLWNEHFSKRNVQYFVNYMGLKHNLLIKTTTSIFIVTATIFIVLRLFTLISASDFFFMPLIVIAVSLISTILFERVFDGVQNEFIKILRLITESSHKNIIARANFEIYELKVLQKFMSKNILTINKITQEKTLLQEEKYLNTLKTLERNSKYNELLLKKHALEDSQSKDKEFLNKISLLVHDIKSPITLINHVIEQNHELFKNDDINIIQFANKRTLSLVQGLLKHYKKNEAEEDIYFNITLIVEKVFTEYKITYKDINFNFNYDLQFINTYIYGNQSSFERMLINIISNAIDAVKSTENSFKEIILILTQNSSFITLNIKDNGIGMPDNIKKLFLTNKPTKSTKKNGNGLGLLQIRETISNFLAVININNKTGTEFILKFQLQSIPHWICTNLNLDTSIKIIILDDDEYIHKIWHNLFQKLTSSTNITINHFYNVSTYENYRTNISDSLDNYLFLCDYDLQDDNINGFELVQKTKFGKSILVTNQFDNKVLQESVSKSGFQILDKQMLPYLLIQLVEPQNEYLDLIWLDDQIFFPDYIIKKFYSHLKVKIFTEPLNFLEVIKNYNHDAIIVLDFNLNLSSDLNGIDIAKKIKAHGFTKIVIITAEKLDLNSLPSNIKILDKTDRVAITNLEDLFK